jgi:hypothetical protein
MRSIACLAAIVAAGLLAAAPILAKDNPGGSPENPAATVQAGPAKTPRPTPAATPSTPGPDAAREGPPPEGRSHVRVAPIFRDVTDADIADITAFAAENMPWLVPELSRQRDSAPEQFRQVCRHLRFEVAQLRDLKNRDPEAFRKAIEEKQLRFRAQDLAFKARAATAPKERDTLAQELRNVLERLFDVEMATRGAQIGQLEGRLDALRKELAQRAASRDQIIKTRLEDALKGKQPDQKYRPSERTEKGDKGDKWGKGPAADRGDHQ